MSTATAKAITIWQPYASLIAMGIKTIETRGWATPYRGPLVIHAARKWDEDIAGECEWAARWLGEHGHREIAHHFEADAIRATLGHALGWSEWVRCERAEGWERGKQALAADFIFGDLADGRIAWRLGPFHAFPEPLAIKGQQGLWDWPGILDGRASA